LVQEGEIASEDQFSSYLYDPAAGLIQIDGDNAQATAMNRHGTVVGTVKRGIEAEFFVYDKKEGLRTQLGPPVSVASDINEHGMVAGWYLTRQGVEVNGSYYARTNSFLYLPKHGFMETGTLGDGYHRMHVVAMNSRGEFAGHADHVDGTRHAFRYSPTNGMQDLGLLGRLGRVVGMTEEGQLIAIWEGRVNPTDRDSVDAYSLFIDQDNERTPLRSLGRGDSEAVYMNQYGQVVGRVSDENGVKRAFIADEGGSMRFLEVPRDQITERPLKSSAMHINDYGQIVGAIREAEGILFDPNVPLYQMIISQWRPAIWDASKGQLEDIELVGEKEAQELRGLAMSINAAGQIVMVGYHKGDQGIRIYLLQPTEEDAETKKPKAF
jgi:probable HAF family extracellular repeat protein